MLELDYSQIVFLFAAYSILGWMCESFIVSVMMKSFVNRGFLFGPYNMTFGFGALLIIYLSGYVENYTGIVFLISAVVATLLEFVVSIIFEKLFGARWWEHKREKFNIKGRIGLLNFLGFGVLGIIVVYLINPQLNSLIDWFHPVSLRVLCTFVLAVIILDLIFSIASLLDIRERLLKLKGIEKRIHRMNVHYGYFNDDNPSIEDIENCHKEHPDNNELYFILSDLKNILDIKKGEGRVLKAFPQMLPFDYFDEYAYFRNAKNKITAEIRDYVDHHRPKSVIKRLTDINETDYHVVKTHKSLGQNIKDSYKGVTFTRLVWIFLIGCVVGYIIETMYCILHNGYIESRQGMIYGPFSQVYGFGAVLLVLLLDPISKKKMIWLFLFSAFVGGLFEAGISYFQEVMFGTRSWDYSDSVLSMFGGRTSGEYMFIWGILGTVYMRIIYPKLTWLVDKIPKNSKVFLTSAIAVILVLDLLISGIAVDRWSARQNNIHPKNAFEREIDEHYNDKYMREVYPHMKIT